MANQIKTLVLVALLALAFVYILLAFVTEQTVLAKILWASLGAGIIAAPLYIPMIMSKNSKKIEN